MSRHQGGYRYQMDNQQSQYAESHYGNMNGNFASQSASGYANFAPDLYAYQPSSAYYGYMATTNEFYHQEYYPYGPASFKPHRQKSRGHGKHAGQGRVSGRPTNRRKAESSETVGVNGNLTEDNTDVQKYDQKRSQTAQADGSQSKGKSSVTRHRRKGSSLRKHQPKSEELNHFNEGGNQRRNPTEQSNHSLRMDSHFSRNAHSKGQQPKTRASYYGSRCSHKRDHNFTHTTQEDIESQRGAMIEELNNNTYECMVCYGLIRHDTAVWNCSSCYHIFHLYCIKKWARSSTAAEDNSTGWRCPACQNINEQFPNQYKCFCGKVTNPQVNRHETPHSCGEVCGKERPNGCIHPCNILCHPGPCPPCLVSVTKYCDCHKTEQIVKCGQASTVKCTNKCEKTLNCGRHECQQVCHPGPCEPCQQLVDQVCFCGKTARTVSCGSAESFETRFCCKLVCDRTLSCNNHNCNQICHPGPCDDCILLPSVVTHCPCGKTKLTEMTDVPERTSCIDPVPTCGNICNKLLNCRGKDGEQHRCQRECHPGPCGPCQGMSEVTCRCGRLTEEMTCEKSTRYTDENPFLCQTRCNKKRLCGRHKCGKACCVDTEHKCDLMCGRKLSCGLHRCDEPCHRGNCPTCWQVSFDELHCHCGLQVIYPPVPCGTRPPECNQPCTRPRACGHPVRHNCHVEDQCPPCTELTEKWCNGKHELRRNIYCYQKEVSCGMPCNKPLPCGVHTCQKICHKGDCLLSDETCTQPCPRPRPLCGHPCSAPCHGSDPCPSGPCKAEVMLRCECGNREEKGLCMLGGDESKADFLRLETSLLAMSIASAQHGESIDISALMNESNRKKPRRLECTSQCSIRERNKRLALALEIKNPDLSGKLGNPTYTTFLKDYARQHLTFVASIEQELSKLVNMAQQSKQPKRSYAFKPMSSVQRRVVHELAEYYGCETQSYDEEPNKNVVATAYKNKCWHPTVSLTQLIQRELHPKAPTPIPHHGSETDIRSKIEASKKSTSVLGAWGKLRPTATTDSSAVVSKPAS